VTSRIQPQCAPTCARYRSPLNPDTPEGLPKPWCAAFPEGIPASIWNNLVDHRQPVDGDHGLRWLSKDGAPYPEHVLLGYAV